MSDIKRKSTINQLIARLENVDHENVLLKQANKNLEARLKTALDCTGLYIWELDVPTKVLSLLNQSFGEMCGYQPNELEATVDNWKNNIHPQDKERVVAALENHLNGKTPYYFVVHRMVHKSGRDIWVSDRGRITEFDESGVPLKMMGTHINITEEKSYELELTQHAMLDPLTQLLNRNGLQKAFDEFIKSSHYCGGSLLFIDVDDFKMVNDRHGHKTGDHLLQHITMLLKSLVPEFGQIGRFGGDEFIILCDLQETLQLVKLSEHILATLSTPKVINNIQFQPSVSIGICTFRRTEENLLHIYERADQAMYKVKRKGKNNFSFFQ